MPGDARTGPDMLTRALLAMMEFGDLWVSTAASLLRSRPEGTGGFDSGPVAAHAAPESWSPAGVQAPVECGSRYLWSLQLACR